MMALEKKDVLPECMPGKKVTPPGHKQKSYSPDLGGSSRIQLPDPVQAQPKCCKLDQYRQPHHGHQRNHLPLRPDRHEHSTLLPRQIAAKKPRPGNSTSTNLARPVRARGRAPRRTSPSPRRGTCHALLRIREDWRGCSLSVGVITVSNWRHLLFVTLVAGGST